MLSIVQIGSIVLVACSLVYLVISWKPSVAYFSLGRPSPRRPILIFAATKFFGSDITNERFLSQCTSSKDWCSISSKSEDFVRADAVVFHNPDFRAMKQIPENNTRNLDIPYVLWSLESPSNDVFITRKDFINWTMTYRRDADVWTPYGKIVRTLSSENKSAVDYDRIWTSKNHPLPPTTWLASNCHAANNRTEIVEKLEKLGLKVDKWGGCGRSPPCDARRSAHDGCSELIRKYKFYLAFENSNCVDYVTEKFFETLRTREAVPIVLHRKIYDELRIPSTSFIALSDYPSLNEAVKEISRIAGNKTEYLEYHRVLPEQNDETGFCALCKNVAELSKLSAENRFASRKSYRSVQEWHSVGMCNNSIPFN